MIYSLARIGEWTNLEIGRRYGISETDVHKVVDNYPQLREALLRNPLRDVSPQAPESGLTMKKPRKRRSDAIYATAKDRQAAYRSRLKQSRCASIEQPVADGPTNRDLSVTVCQDSEIEAGLEKAYPQQTTS